MSRRPARATQADIFRAIKAARQADARMALEILSDGTIRLVPMENSGKDQEPQLEPKREIVL